MDLIIKPGNKLRGEIYIPGDKSISHRVIMCASLASGISTIKGLLESTDCLATIQAFRDMGIEISQQRELVIVEGKGLYGLKKPNKELDFGRIWAGLSYRRSFDGAEYSSEDALGNITTQAQKLEYITPLLGLEVNSFVFAYNYSYQSNSIVFDNGGYHQLTLGFNFGCRKERYDCNCPWIK